MIRTPDEIKKGLECCHSTDVCECEECPYSVDGEETMNCDILLSEDANEYIRRLEERNTWHESNEKYLASFMKDLSRQIEQLEAERDAAVKALVLVSDKVEQAQSTLDNDIHSRVDYDTYLDLRNMVDDIMSWQYESEGRGVQKEA